MRIIKSTIREKKNGAGYQQIKPRLRARRTGKINNFPIASLTTSVKLGAQTSLADSRQSPDVKGHFDYRPLNSNKNEIRLLQILPVRKYDGLKCGIECNIYHASLSDLPDYDALSYVWGDRGNLRSISLDGNPFYVTANLYSALSHLQSSSTTRPLWIDAICINQDNLGERSEQVVKMSDIFKQAAKVITWLGDADIQSELAFSLLRDLKDRLQDRNSFLKLLNEPQTVEYLYGLYRLFYRDYWWRVWVIQEVALAKTITILCGADSFLWSDLVSIQENLAMYHLRDIDKIAHSRPELSFLRVSIESRGPRAMCSAKVQGTADLTQILLQHRFKDSSDPKDMIYSLIGLSNAHSDPRLVVDYSKSVCQVYTDVVEFVLTTTKKLDIICAMPRGTNQYALPSWVPDWSFHGTGSTLLEHNSKHQFSAAGTSETIARVSSDRKVLRVKGVLLELIDAIGVVCDMDDMEDERRAVVAFLEWQKLFVSVLGDATVLGESFCRNILREKYSANQVKIWTEKSDFLQWIIGILVDAIIIVHPNIELDAHLSKFRGYRAAWRLPEDDQVMSMIVLKGIAEMMFGRRVFISNNGLIGLAPENLEIGDILSIVLGCQLPIVLRPEKDHYIYLGEAFIDGYMYGKVMHELEGGVRKLVTFNIR